MKDLDIGVLVNNVGMSYTHADDYVMVPEDKHVDILNINCMSVSKTCQLYKSCQRCNAIILAEYKIGQLNFGNVDNLVIYCNRW